MLLPKVASREVEYIYEVYGILSAWARTQQSSDFVVTVECLHHTGTIVTGLGPDVAVICNRTSLQ